MNPGCLSEITYTDFARPINKKLESERIPISGTIELTHQCNLRCVHCYCNLSAENERVKALELSTSELLRILGELEAKGCLWLLLTGGEPFLREDFFDLYIDAKKKGFLITLYGATSEVYERITGVSGSFSGNTLFMISGNRFFCRPSTPGPANIFGVRIVSGSFCAPHVPAGT